MGWGPVGSGTSEVADALREYLDNSGYDAHVLKARNVIVAWAAANSFDLPAGQKMDQTEKLQDGGDELRRSANDSAAVAHRLINEITRVRAKSLGIVMEPGKAVMPNGMKRAYILDSLRNPGEVDLLRRLYQNAFCLIGIVCDEDTRTKRLQDKYADAGKDRITRFMKRDERASEKHGQQVSETFHLADFFINNSASRFVETPNGVKSENVDWMVAEEPGRLVDILTNVNIIRPRAGESAMYHAYGARMRSSCLSRQVGAALVDQQGNLVAT